MLIVFSAFLFAESADSNTVKPVRHVNGVYRILIENKDGMKIWIVDGLVIRREIFAEFVYGGNPAPYLFVPKNEIWIDHAISVEEFEYTLAHELNEYKLMMKNGMSYTDAHNSSLTLERFMRKKDFAMSQKHESEIHKVSPTDCDGLKQIKELPDSISLVDVYKQKYSSISGIDIWVVDGSKVRKEIFPDFGFSGNDLAYHFIPTNEIWIDGQVSCEETEISILTELDERSLMKTGLSFDDAYNKTIKKIKEDRNNLFKTTLKHSPIIIPSTLTREYSVGK